MTMAWNTVRSSSTDDVVVNPDNSEGFQKFLPVEIVEMIVQEVLHSQSRTFSSVAALSVVSRQFRHISLRAYFSKLSVHRLTKASRINDVPNSYSWVR
jgi:hypothetical protein